MGWQLSWCEDILDRKARGRVNLMKGQGRSVFVGEGVYKSGDDGGGLVKGGRGRSRARAASSQLSGLPPEHDRVAVQRRQQVVTGDSWKNAL